MVGSPAPDHSAQHEELAALYALRALEEEERVSFERHLGACAACRRRVAEDQWTVARLAAAVPAMDPPAGMKERLLRRAARELEAARPADRALAPLPFRRRRPAWAFPLAAAVALVLGAAAVLGQQSYTNQVVATVALQGASPGSATVLLHRSGAAELELRGLADPPAGHVYEAWVIGADGKPLPAGTAAAGGSTLRLTGPVRGSTVAVTVEPAPGTAAPTSQPFLVGKVEA